MCRKGRDLHLTHEYAVAGNTFQIHILKARLRILTSSLLEMPLRAPHACQHRAGALPEHPAPISAPPEIQLQSQDRVRRHNAGRRRQETLGKTQDGKPMHSIPSFLLLYILVLLWCLQLPHGTGNPPAAFADSRVFLSNAAERAKEEKRNQPNYHQNSKKFHKLSTVLCRQRQ